jgi:hypothetical protein
VDEAIEQAYNSDAELEESDGGLSEVARTKKHKKLWQMIEGLDNLLNGPEELGQAPSKPRDTSRQGGQLFSLPADFDHDSDSTVDLPNFAHTPPHTQSAISDNESLSVNPTRRHQVAKDSKHKHNCASSSKHHSALLLTDSESDVEIVEDIANIVDLSQANSGCDRKGKGRVIELQC